MGNRQVLNPVKIVEMPLQYKIYKDIILGDNTCIFLDHFNAFCLAHSRHYDFWNKL